MESGGRNLVLGTAGHIDHGKTALVRALTGVDTDRLPAERQRGITIDLGFASLELGEDRLAVVDVPGHERFIRNMLAGASGLDLAMLVVAADDSVMPQTREHLEILELLGLSGGLVALTKCDLADASWTGLVEDEVRELVRGTFLEGAPIVRTAATTGLGIDALKAELAALCGSATIRPDPGLFRMAVDRSFTVAGHGTVVTGTVASGEVAVGDELEWQPEGRVVRVRGLHRHDRPVDRVGRGSRAAINVAGVHHEEVRRGHELAAPGYLRASKVLSVQLSAAEDAARPLRHRGRYRVHLGTAEVSATLALLEGNALAAGSGGLGQLFLAEPVVAVHGQPLVIREESPPATLGGGRVVQPLARRLRRRDEASMDRLRRLRSADPKERAAAALAFLGLNPASDRELCALAGIPIGEVPGVLDELTRSGALVEVPIGPRRTTRVLAEFVADLEDRVLRALSRLHAARPRHSAIPRAHLAAELPDLSSEALIAGVIDRLKARGEVLAEARTVAAKGHSPKLSQGERKLKEELHAAIRAGGISPPEVSDLAATAGSRAAVVPDLLALLRDEQRAVEISPSLFLDFDAAADLRRRVREHLEGGRTMTMADLRDLLSTTRKYAVPIGEYLDRIGLTRREGDVRRLGDAEA
ncbi:Selenocysteine-specific elongation factor [Aquisphaera giovannonii]|uniref:Selenocysteine-specific elongation factor n=1 Tax=Aquisphaera giovannonii TaxID=406548 RepID=A0A5B9WEV7_9BACT|nr:selenocysteine-specific translation elongation factor [Aquisphaera giovannonii]QEH38481.1 Selenocysteine-specific elongation factor [Aquisphaera giovannonii]